MYLVESSPHKGVAGFTDRGWLVRSPLPYFFLCLRALFLTIPTLIGWKGNATLPK